MINAKLDTLRWLLIKEDDRLFNVLQLFLRRVICRRDLFHQVFVSCLLGTPRVAKDLGRLLLSALRGPDEWIEEFLRVYSRQRTLYRRERFRI